MTGLSTSGDESEPEADAYEVLASADIDDEPPEYQPLGPGDVLEGIRLAHLAVPFYGCVDVVGHPCSLRRGLELQADKLLPPGTSKHHVVDLIRTTTVPAAELRLERRRAALSNAGVVALQQRVVGNNTRVKIPPQIIAAHCRGPFVELELWRDCRERREEAGLPVDTHDGRFNEFMDSQSGFGDLTWRQALGEREDARARAVTAMTELLDELM